MRRRINLPSAIVPLISPLLFLGCGEDPLALAPTQGHGSVGPLMAVAPETVALAPGESVQLNASITDRRGGPLEQREWAENEGLRWASSNQEVASVSEDGLVQALGLGEVTITADYGPLSAMATVVVTENGRHPRT